LTIEEDKPTPGGDAKGLWKACPEIPLPRWGTAFARNAPPEKVRHVVVPAHRSSLLTANPMVARTGQKLKRCE